MTSLKAKNSELKVPFKREFSAGGVVCKKTDKKVLWLVGKHSGYHKWVLPKGLIEKEEKGIETAVREVEEETGIKAQVLGGKPIYKEEYWFAAELSNQPTNKQQSTAESKTKPVRRVAVYQEDKNFEKARGKVRILKTVSYYFMEYLSGDVNKRGWEMSEAGWFEYDKALEKLSFEGEKEALKKAKLAYAERK